MSSLSDADIEQLHHFAAQLRNLLAPLNTLSISVPPTTQEFSAEIFPGLASRQNEGWDVRLPDSYKHMVATIEAGLVEMERLLQRGEYSAYLTECCELLGRQTITLLVTLKRQQRQLHAEVPALASLVGLDKNRMAMQRLQQQIDQRGRELQQQLHLRDRFQQEATWQKGASTARRDEIERKLHAATDRIEQITQEIAYSRERLENIRLYIQLNKIS